MPSTGAIGTLANRAADVIRQAFADYMAEFDAISRLARTRFENRDWPAHRSDVLGRLELYPGTVEATVERLEQMLGNLQSDRTLWVEIKSAFTRGPADPNSELAQTFYNSITRRIFKTVGVNPEIEFASLDLAIRDWDPDPEILRTYPSSGQETFFKILEDYRFGADYRDVELDSRLVTRRVKQRLESEFGSPRIDSIELLRSVLYRNKAAYLVGRIHVGERTMPLIVVLLNSPGGVYVDAVLLRESDVSILFSFTRSYFQVEAACPRQLIVFLKAIIPLKPVSDLYTALGFNKHGKTELFRSLQRHLNRTSDRFEYASGDRGMVMLVFSLPSYDRVFKVIRDSFDYPKTTTARNVMERYRLVYKRDRVGRLVEAQRFLQLKIRVDRFEDDLLRELTTAASRSVEREGDFLVFRYLYTERKVRPLNLYLREADHESAARAVLDYGEAIKELAAANIFPGDFLLKNFGVTRHGRVVFYDYDELCLLTDCNFRRFPESRTPEQELESEPWYSVAENDVFPEEFRKFLGLPPSLRELFEQYHDDLFTAEFWIGRQQLAETGEMLNFFPYPRGERIQLFEEPD